MFIAIHIVIPVTETQGQDREAISMPREGESRVVNAVVNCSRGMMEGLKSKDMELEFPGVYVRLQSMVL